jgi:assimilatory nitrate reductase catalytic subunit
MTRTGLSPRLGQHLPEPFVEVHPDDAAQGTASPTATSRASPPITGNAR